MACWRRKGSPTIPGGHRGLHDVPPPGTSVQGHEKYVAERVRRQYPENIVVCMVCHRRGPAYRDMRDMSLKGLADNTWRTLWPACAARFKLQMQVRTQCTLSARSVHTQCTLSARSVHAWKTKHFNKIECGLWARDKSSLLPY